MEKPIKPIKVYEAHFRTGDKIEDGEFVLWIATNGTIENHTAVQVKEIEVDPNAPGIDLTITV